MVVPVWRDEVDIDVFVSTAGDFVTLGVRNDFPFVAGGPGGAPVGWTTYFSAGGVAADVNMSVNVGRFSVSNAGTVSHATRVYGIQRSFPVKQNKRYLLQVQARTMEDKTAAYRQLDYTYVASGVTSGSRRRTETSWEQISIDLGIPRANDTSVTVRLWGYFSAPVDSIDWGFQYQNFALVEQETSYPEPTWEEVTCDVRSFVARFGRDKFTSRYDTATMSLAVLNDDGQFAYRPEGQTLRPGRFVKAVAKIVGVPIGTYNLYYGIIDSLQDSFTLDGHATVIINCVDVSSLLANQDVMTSGSDTWTYLSGARFNGMLTAAGWHPTKRSVMPGVFTQQAVFANGRSYRDELGLIADSEGGYFFADRQGNIVYNDRTWSTIRHRTVYAEILAVRAGPTNLDPVDDFPTILNPTVICARELSTSWSRDRIVNVLSLANQGGTAVVTTDVASQRKFGPRTYQRLDFLNVNSEPDYLALRTQDIMDGYTDAILRVNTVSFKPGPGDFWWLMTAWFNDAVRVRYEHPTEGWGFAIVSHIQGIEYAIDANDWVATLMLDDPDTFTYWTAAPPGEGWDSATWDEDVWDGVREPGGVYWSDGQKWSEGAKWG
jgi:hypothetical protein